MAVANTFAFGGVSTSEFGLTVEGSGNYSAPKRAVETIEIPGRNGAYQLDKGYYENIEADFDVVVKGTTQEEFRENIEEFRNAIVSQVGYQRLEETYLPNEYRMATYAGGLDEDPQFHGNGAVFKVKFDCKPQRWLTSGEDAISVDSGDVISNPTLFDASPLLEVEGYGTLDFNGYEIELDNAVMGEVTVAESGPVLGTVPLNTAIYNDGDTITVGGTTVNVDVRPYFSGQRINAITSTSSSGDGSYDYYLHGTLRAGITITLPSFSSSSTSTNSVTETVTLVMDMILNGNTHQSVTFSTTVTITYADDAVTGVRTSTTSAQRVISSTATSTFSGATADSTVNILGHPTYIDCDLGEAYKIENDEYISLNRYIDLGSDLPKLAVGNNTFTFDNTVTDLKVVPRWWKI